ncbi:hypothetical protein LCGC14_0356320 [marine sediment metagenome]|uniref:Uncharacterized protein n=1 Tax=marine sediment metagenome TaxID=412755 RepID=A0A0F9T9K5_9ZZZZ
MAVTLAEYNTLQRLAAVANNEFWYEDINVAAGTMVELAAANGDIDTTDNLNIFEYYQKVIVVNGTKLKIADFVNTKLTVTALTTAPTRGAIVTQLTSGATMVVDFVNAAKTIIYGKTTNGTFTTTTGHTLSGGSMDPTTRVPSAVAEASTTPHWYDYVVYPDSASGSLPATAYIGCSWRGRAVLSGNPDDPQQWYMSRQADHTDFAYVANDVQSPVAGGEDPNVPGKTGDVVRALIPRGKDYLILGCATSMWVFAGDPADGGTLSELDDTVGIFGANSWTLDEDENLYFWGTGGVYKISRGLNTVENLTNISLPGLIGDEAADPTTHRITIAYDRKRFGLVICITKLSDGSNSNYFYSLPEVTRGFYPESYPDECGAYSSFYYAANDTTLRDLLIGCKDGYIRKFDEADKDDDIGASDQAISSYVTLGPLKLAKENKEGIIHSIAGYTAGGDTGSTEDDSDDIGYKVFMGRSSAKAAEKAAANTSPKVSGTLQTPARPRGRTKKQKIRGVYTSIRLENTTAAETMSFDRLLVKTQQRGRVK